jgi:MFS family permease
MMLSSSSVFFITGAICTIGFLIVGLIFQEPITKLEPKNWLADIKETFNWRHIREEKEYFFFLISHFLLHTGINVYMPFLLIFLTQQNNPASGELIGLGLSLENGQVLVVFAIMTVISLLFSIPTGYLIDKLNKRHFLIISRLFFALTTGLIAITPVIKSVHPLIISVLFIIPFSLANTADIISRGAVMHHLVPHEKRGQLLGTLFLAKIIAQIPGVLIGGLLAYFFQHGYQFGFVFSTIFLLASIPFLFSNKFKVGFFKNKKKEVPAT